MNNLRSFLASLRFSSNSFDVYYANLVAQGVGYPTADEARKDRARREQALLNNGINNFR